LSGREASLKSPARTGERRLSAAPEGKKGGMSTKRSMLALRLESDRMIYLDLLRLFASYLIITYHFQNQMGLGGAADAVRAILDGFTLSVDLFFFISGFVISSVYAGRITSGASYRDYLAKRVARLGPLHWATFSVFAVFGVLHALGKMPSNHPELYDTRCALPNLLLLHAFGLCRGLTFNYVSWSISAEMGMYVLFPLIALIAARRQALLAVAVLIALLTLAARATGGSWLDWSFDFGALRAIPSFLLGAVAFQRRAALARVPQARVWLLAACVAFVAGCVLHAPRSLLLALVYVIGALGVAASEQPASAAARRVAPLGQLTYSLYMLHPLVQTVLLTGIGAGALKLRGAPMTLFVVAAMALMIPIAWASLALFERPARRGVTRLLGARPRRAPEPALFTPDSRW
jgi:peptidoglycan/LPS O-acetylase OafA/YrhL